MKELYKNIHSIDKKSFLLKLKMLRISRPRTVVRLMENPIMNQFFYLVDNKIEELIEKSEFRCDLPFAVHNGDSFFIPDDWEVKANELYSIETLRGFENDTLLAIRTVRWIYRCNRMCECGPPWEYPNFWNFALHDGRVEWIAKSILN